MKAIVNRLRRLEERRMFRLQEGRQAQYLTARLEAARRRCELPPISPERLAGLRGIASHDLIEILLLGRKRGTNDENGRGL